MATLNTCGVSLGKYQGQWEAGSTVLDNDWAIRVPGMVAGITGHIARTMWFASHC